MTLDNQTFAVNSVWIPDMQPVSGGIITTTGTGIDSYPQHWYEPVYPSPIQPQIGPVVPFRVNIPEPQFDMQKLIEALMASGFNAPPKPPEEPKEEEKPRELKFSRKLEP